MDGARNWGHTVLAAVIAGVGALALIAATSAPEVTASSGSSKGSPASLGILVAKAKAELIVLAAQVQTAREAIAAEKVEIGKERGQLALVVSDEYTRAPNGLLSVLASPDFNSALDTQIELDQMTKSQRQLLLKLAQEVKDELANESALKDEQRQEEVDETRLQAEEVVAEFQATEAQLQATEQASGSAQSPPSRGSAATPGSTPTPTPTVQVTPSPTTVPPTPSSPPPTGTGGAFSVTTNLTLPSGITEQQIQEFLNVVPSPLVNDASYFLQAEQTNHVSAIYLVAEAVLETGWGTSSIYLNKHNLFGFGADDSNPYGDAETFSSDGACIAYVSSFIHQQYLTPGGAYYTSAGPTLLGMNHYYASNLNWATSVAKLGAELQAEPS
ncbi:MAG: glucosaminidase domain-containing protein [Candidatus Dormibacteria bacterium]